MKVGKLPEPVLIRSVLKQVQHRREEVLIGPGVGRDCAVMELKEDEVFVLSSDPITGTTKDLGRHCIHITANDLAAGGAEPVGVMLTVLLPDTIEEQEIRKMVKDTEAVCKELNMEVLGGHTEVTNVVTQPLISVTGIGKMKKERLNTLTCAKPNQDLVVTKWIGLEATAILAKEKEELLKERFPLPMIETAKSFDQYLSVVPESAIAMEHGVSVMHDVTEGGIFGAFWEMASGAGTGLEIDMKKIPIRQETVEICEYFGVNPYQIMSSGSMLIACDDGYELVRKLQNQGIYSAVVGRTTSGNDRILRNGEDVRYLDRPQPDELYKVMG